MEPLISQDFHPGARIHISIQSLLLMQTLRVRRRVLDPEAQRPRRPVTPAQGNRTTFNNYVRAVNGFVLRNRGGWQADKPSHWWARWACICILSITATGFPSIPSPSPASRGRGNKARENRLRLHPHPVLGAGKRRALKWEMQATAGSHPIPVLRKPTSIPL